MLRSVPFVQGAGGVFPPDTVQHGACTLDNLFLNRNSEFRIPKNKKYIFFFVFLFYHEIILPFQVVAV